MHTLGVGTTRRMKSVITGIFFPSLRMTDYTVKERINIWRGKYDETCCYELQKEYFDFLQAPETYFFTFENSAHSPLFEEPGQTAEIIKLIKEKEKQ